MSIRCQPPVSDFRTTRWSIVLSAVDRSAPQARQALEQLCRAYWRPLYAFVRRQGRDPHEAEDLTQSFFAVLIEKNFVAEAEPERGRFRSFLLTPARIVVGTKALVSNSIHYWQQYATPEQRHG